VLEDRAEHGHAEDTPSSRIALLAPMPVLVALCAEAITVLAIGAKVMPMPRPPRMNGGSRWIGNRGRSDQGDPDQGNRLDDHAREHQRTSSQLPGEDARERAVSIIVPVQGIVPKPARRGEKCRTFCTKR